jgi:hypothetical protein
VYGKSAGKILRRASRHEEQVLFHLEKRDGFGIHSRNMEAGR